MFVFSLFGMNTVVYIMARFTGLNYSRKWSILVWEIFWCFRYFGFSLYLSTYLADRYSQETWFQWLFIIACLVNIIVGILMIRLLFAGDLRKNLMLWLFVECLVSAAGLFPVVLVWGDQHIMDKPFNFWDPRELFIFIYYPLFLLGTWKLLNMGESWIMRFRKWKPKHTRIIDFMIVAYMIMGFFSNIGFVLTRGNVGILIFSIFAAIFLYILWAFFLQKEQKRALDTNQEMLRQEAMLQNYYKQISAQSSKIYHFNSEIQHSLDNLVKTLSKHDEEMPDDQEAANLLKLARDYRQKLEDHYQEITLSKYSGDPAVNDLLVSYEEAFRNLGVSVLYSFQRYHRPKGIKSGKIEALLAFLLDGAKEQYVKQDNTFSDRERDKTSASEDAGQVFLQGGLAGERLILSCQYQGQEPSGKSKRKLNKIIRQLGGDCTIFQKDHDVKIIVGVG